MDERELLRGTLARARRALQFLEQQAAGFGLLHIPANLQIELEEKREEVARLEARLAEADRQPQARITALDIHACPYPGMVPFRLEDSPFFYGRDTEIRFLIQHLRQQRYFFVIGPSGSGKSSLVFAGLLLELQESRLFPAGFWLIRDMRPGTQPLRALAQALGGDPAQAAEAIAGLLDAHQPAQRLLLVIDQFEELFTQAGRFEQAQFVTALQGLRGQENCALILTMRADFYPDLMQSDLWPVEAVERLEVAPLRGPALRQAIEQPALELGVRLEPGLLERLMDDAASEPGLLPLIQETMRLLWGDMQDEVLTLSAYRALGSENSSGLAVAIATQADATLAALTPAQRQIARRIFLSLVQINESGPDTRRRSIASNSRPARCSTRPASRSRPASAWSFRQSGLRYSISGPISWRITTRAASEPGSWW